jgi:fermentation-respiration switch protein FrsA (DUF1100 family)
LKLKLILHVTSAADGAWRATLDSPDVGAKILKIDSFTVEGATVKFTIRTVDAAFEGTLKGDEIAGTFKQAGIPLPLVFKRATAADLDFAPPKRPQTPQPPFPYVAEDVTYDNPAAQIKLAGTLTLPRATAPVPAVILVSGSGPQGRIEEGPYAAKSSEVAFIVMMAGPGVTIEEILYEQAALIARAQGAEEDAIAQNRKTLEKIFAILKTEKDPAAADKKLAELGAAEVAAAPEAQKKALEASLSTNFKMTNSPWFRFLLTFDPRLVLRQVKAPVLALNGELDLQVPPQQNLPEIAKALTASGNKNFKTVTLPKLNHLFQTAQTGAVSEYTKIEETIAPAALTLITEWIANQTGLANKPR